MEILVPRVIRNLNVMRGYDLLKHMECSYPPVMENCSLKDGGPSTVNVELFSPTGDVVSSALSTPRGTYSFKNTIPIELGFENRVVDNFIFVIVLDYDIRGSVVAQEREYYERQIATLKSFEEVDSLDSADNIDEEKDIIEQAQHERAMHIYN
ncbi:hypothetical protein T459_09068 [Capsicum annuum]|uniref:Uncharacterized protein n=1 Tax=Capsicum annuum TaxID=4072 RepID=A0A2G2ZY96_CAPAN|nr:hypothetical protein T459_09068 [Capsicum annuum]